jgi:hypothetical protein
MFRSWWSVPSGVRGAAGVLARGGFVGADADGLLVALLVGAAEVLAGLLAKGVGAAGNGWGRGSGA